MVKLADIADLSQPAILFKGKHDDSFVPGDLRVTESQVLFYRTTNLIIEALLKMLRLYRQRPYITIEKSNIDEVVVMPKPALLRFINPRHVLEFRAPQATLRFGIDDARPWLDAGSP